MTRHTVMDSGLGELTLVADGAELIGLYFPHHWYRPAEQAFGPRVDIASDDLFGRARHEVTSFLAGERTAFDVPTRLVGDAGARRVWELLEAIPYGETVTYGELAAEVGGDATARDVGQTVGRNPLSIVVPCHRVVGKNGGLTGYAGGLDRKRFLLELEEPVCVREARLF